MSEENLFAFAVGRIRVREKYLLSNEDVAQMIALPDEGAVLSFLSEKGWGESKEDETAEQMLMIEEKKTRDLMRELGLDAEITEVLAYPLVYHNVKAGIKEICTEEKNQEAFYPDERFGRDQVLEILREKEFHKLPSHMQKAAERAFQTMLTARDGQLCDVILDRACLDAMEEVAEHSEHEILRDYEKESVAVANIRIAVRAAKTGKRDDFLKEALAPCKSLDADGLRRAALGGEESLLSYLSAQGYAEAAEALKESPSAFERWCDNRQIEAIRPQKINPFTPGPVVAYYLARQNEIRTARIILTAKANGFTEEEIRERVREMYV